MIIVRCSYPPPSQKGGSKTQIGRFPSKIALRLWKVCYKVSSCKNCQRKSCKAFIGLSVRAKMIGGATLLPEILDQIDRVGAKSPIFDLFSLVAPQPYIRPSEKVQLTLIRSPLCAFQWAQDEHRTLSLSPQRGIKNAVSKFWTLSCDNCEMVRDRMLVTINH